MFLVVSTHLWTIAQLEHLPPKSEWDMKQNMFGSRTPQKWKLPAGFLNTLPQSEDLEAGRVRITDSKDPQFDPAVSQMAKYISVVQTECPCTQWHWCSNNCGWSQFQESQIQWYKVDWSRLEIARHQGELSIRVFHPPELVSHFLWEISYQTSIKGVINRTPRFMELWCGFRATLYDMNGHFRRYFEWSAVGT